MHHRSRIGAEDVVGIHPPLRIVDTIYPYLRLDRHAAILLNKARGTLNALVSLLLTLLHGDGPVLPVACVDLDASLICGDVQLDSRRV